MRLLAVEDDPTIASFVAKGLQEAGYAVDVRREARRLGPRERSRGAEDRRVRPATARIGNPDRVRVGDVVLAIGDSLGVGQTVPTGIVGAKDRATGLNDGTFEDFLRADAPINQGNSGGALVNTEGELVGINTQILSPSGGGTGIGFAIPVSMAQNVIRQLVAHGVVRRAMLGPGSRQRALPNS